MSGIDSTVCTSVSIDPLSLVSTSRVDGPSTRVVETGLYNANTV